MKDERWKQDGWRDNGEWDCPRCGRGFGKNLLGDRPFGLVAQHVCPVETKGKVVTVVGRLR